MFKLINSCRLCRSYENIYITLHHIDSDNLSFFQKLNRIAPGIVENNANLPDDICTNCITELNISYKFINKCSESQAIFQRYLEQLQIGQQVQPANNREILIKVVKLEESNCNSEVKSFNSVTVKDEKKSGFLNEETNDEYNVNDYANDNSESNQADFENDIKVEEEIRNILANLKNENIEEICNDFTDDIQTNQRSKDIKLEHNFSLRPSEELTHLYDEDDNEFTKIGHHSDSINMNNEYEFTEVKNITCIERKCMKENDKSVKKTKSHKCTLCEKTFTRSYSLKRHVRSHTNERPYKCKICEKAFNQSGSLKEHIRSHTQERPYKCEICKRTLTVSRNLKVHIRSHTKERPYKCEICEKTFTQSGNLRKHIRLHTNEKP